LGAIYVSTKPELKMLSDLVKIIQSDAAIFYHFYINPFMIFSLVLLAIFSGSDLISQDIQYHSITLYMSRPISRLDYLGGKFSIVLFYLLLYTLLPGALLILAKIIFTGQISISLYLLLAALLFPFLYALFFASAILLASSLSRNSRFVILMFLLLFFATQPVAKILESIFKNDYFNYISVTENLRQFGALVFNQNPVFDAPMWPSAVIICILTALFTYFIHLRLKKIEV
jgi:ABC-type transport system involved in multi-copper enzyme maturation permease subunit